MHRDLVLVNGHVMTMDPLNPVVSAVTIRAGRVVHVGSDTDARAAAGPRADIIDLAGRTATPGLNDAHNHPMLVGYALADVDISPEAVGSIAGLQVAIQARARVTGDGGWVVGRGYDQARMTEQRHPTRHDLDEVVPDKPVFLFRACHHIAAVNSLALKIAGVTADTRDPEGGSIDRDEHGEPTGVLRETAMELVRPFMPAPTEDQIAHAIRLAGHAFLRTGVTSVGEAAIRKPIEMTAYQRLRQNDELPVRTYMMLLIDEMQPALESLGIRTGFGDEWLRIGPAKIFLDGSLGGRTARMRAPYKGEAENVGLWMQPPDEMKAKIIRAHQLGFQVTVHAIGDAAIDLILDAYEEAQATYPRSGTRHRIEHCSIVDMPTIERIKRLGAVPIPGTSFLYYFTSAYLQNIGEPLLRYSIAMRTFEEHGIVAAASTDAPIVPVSATVGLGMMMSRTDINGTVIWPEEAVDLTSAIRAYTLNGAYASFEERQKGSLEYGKLGDVAVFETDLRTVAPTDIKDVRVDYTVSEGRVAYERTAGGG
ncbi:MAG: amidohydrolase [Chloroflexota bacterium]|nr:amidohydrolase [Chloroflexota bacterium]